MTRRKTRLWFFAGLALGLGLGEGVRAAAANVRRRRSGNISPIPFGPSVYHTLFGPVGRPPIAPRKPPSPG